MPALTIVVGSSQQSGLSPTTVVIIVGHRRVNRELEYRVRWKGLTAAHDTWEPAENFGSTAAGLDALLAYQEAHEIEPNARDTQWRAPTRQQEQTHKVNAGRNRGPASNPTARAQRHPLPDRPQGRLSDPFCAATP